MMEPPDSGTSRSERPASPSENGDRDALAARLSAVERALGERGPAPAADGPDSSRLTARVAAVEESLAALDERVGEIEAATQALRGYVGGVRAVNRDVERRADAALATVDRLASELGRADSTSSGDIEGMDLTDVDSHYVGSGDGPAVNTDGEHHPDTDPDRAIPEGIAARLRDVL